MSAPDLAVVGEHPQLVTRIADTVLPTRHGEFRMIGYRADDGTEHVALAMGLDAAHPSPTLVRLHSECLTGDALGSRRCDCGPQLQAALARIALEGRGVLVYVRGHEGRGIGLLEKLRAYELQDHGLDTVEANLALGHPADARDYTYAAAVLHDLGLARIRLMSSNPAKERALLALGIEIAERTGMFVPESAENVGYLRTKRARMGHDEPTADAWGELLAGRAPISTHTIADGELVERYGPIATAGPRLVIAQMAQSLDGLIATTTGEGAGLSGDADHTHLHRLRALVDAVVVGATTVANDDPRLTVREVPGPSPVRVVLDPRARVHADARVFTDAASPTLWLVGPSAAVPDAFGDGRGHVEVVRLPNDRPDPADVIDLLAARGLGRVLVEGGGNTVSRFLAAGCLDRLFVTSVPVLLGEGVQGVRPEGAARIRDGVRATRRFLLADDVCTEFTFAREEQASPSDR